MDSAIEDPGERLGEPGVPANLPLCQRFGFRMTCADRAPDGGPHLCYMRRDQG